MNKCVYTIRRELCLCSAEKPLLCGTWGGGGASDRQGLLNRRTTVRVSEPDICFWFEVFDSPHKHTYLVAINRNYAIASEGQYSVNIQYLKKNRTATCSIATVVPRELRRLISRVMLQFEYDHFSGMEFHSFCFLWKTIFLGLA